MNMGPKKLESLNESPWERPQLGRIHMAMTFSSESPHALCEEMVGVAPTLGGLAEGANTSAYVGV